MASSVHQSYDVFDGDLVESLYSLSIIPELDLSVRNICNQIVNLL
jgi:hypothetical protein